MLQNGLVWCVARAPESLRRAFLLYHDGMVGLVHALLFGSAMMLQTPAQQASGQEILPPPSPPPVTAGLPPIPKGKSTVMGGQIRSVDAVRDQFTLKVFGGQAIKILYDERTQVFRDATRLSVLDLHPDDHASVETTLDGSHIFAIRIHLMKQVAEGETRGRVVSFDPQSGDLKVEATASKDTMSFQVPPATPIARVGPMATSSSPQGSTADLTPGAIVDVTFKNGKGSLAQATRVDIVARVGATFVFTGSVSGLDLHAGRLVLAGKNEDETQVIMFDPDRFPVSREVRLGSVVTVTTTFDGTKYVANEIVVK